MHKAGGIISLIAGILAIPALIFTMLFSAGSALAGDVADAGAKGTEAGGYLIGGVIIIPIVLILSIIILNTRTRWPGILMAIACAWVLFSNSAGGFVGACLAFALLGALMSLNLGRNAAVTT